MAIDISKAILEVTQSGEMLQLEKYLLSSSNCSSSIDLNDNPELGPEPFYGLFFVSGSISAFALLITVVRLAQNCQLNMYLILATCIDIKDWIWAVIFLARIHLKFQSSNRRRSSVISETQDARGELNEMEQTHVVAVQ